MTTRDISSHLKSVYGVDASAEMISHMTDRILPVAKEWQNRPLEKKYAIVFMDAVHFHVRQDNQTVKKAVYVAIGIRLNGRKEVLGMWVGGFDKKIQAYQGLPVFFFYSTVKFPRKPCTISVL